MGQQGRSRSYFDRRYPIAILIFVNQDLNVLGTLFMATERLFSPAGYQQGFSRDTSTPR
jgi:hypothetical protein